MWKRLQEGPAVIGRVRGEWEARDVPSRIPVASGTCPPSKSQRDGPGGKEQRESKTRKREAEANREAERSRERVGGCRDPPREIPVN